jgi:hypothetical protein
MSLVQAKADSRIRSRPVVTNEDRDLFFRSEAFTPYGEWEECFLATRALITVMKTAIAGRDEAVVPAEGVDT